MLRFFVSVLLIKHQISYDLMKRFIVVMMYINYILKKNFHTPRIYLHIL